MVCTTVHHQLAMNPFLNTKGHLLCNTKRQIMPRYKHIRLSNLLQPRQDVSHCKTGMQYCARCPQILKETRTSKDNMLTTVGIFGNAMRLRLRPMLKKAYCLNFKIILQACTTTGLPVLRSRRNLGFGLSFCHYNNQLTSLHCDYAQRSNEYLFRLWGIQEILCEINPTSRLAVPWLSKQNTKQTQSRLGIPYGLFGSN